MKTHGLPRIKSGDSINSCFPCLNSHLKRADQTAWPTAEQKFLKITQDIRLRERRSIKQERSVIYPTLPFLKEVETKTDLAARMVAVLCEIARSCNDQVVLVALYLLE